MRLFLCAILLLVTSGCGNGSDLLAHNAVCDGYTKSEDSLYRLPWEAGESHTVSQANCSGVSHFGDQRYAYDFDMPIGTSVRAARAGVVTEVQESYEDGNGCPKDNHVFIRHADGTIGSYVHLTKNGVLPSVGASVAQGDAIGLSGNTGCSGGPHLHFVVFKNADMKDSIPVTFSNTKAHRRALVPGESYEAE